MAGVFAIKRQIVIPFMMKVIDLQHALFPWSVVLAYDSDWLSIRTGTGIS